MATVSTLAAVKRALLDEIGLIGIVSDAAAAPTYVQTAYARPPVDRVRSESVYFGDIARTADVERRLKAGRQVRYITWGFELIASTDIIADAESAERRAFAIAAAVESFLTDYSQPAEWPNSPVVSGAMSLVIDGMESELSEHPEGYQSVEIRIQLTMMERLS